MSKPKVGDVVRTGKFHGVLWLFEGIGVKRDGTMMAKLATKADWATAIRKQVPATELVPA